MLAPDLCEHVILDYYSPFTWQSQLVREAFKAKPDYEDRLLRIRLRRMRQSSTNFLNHEEREDKEEYSIKKIFLFLITIPK